jgi:dihydroorotase
MKTLIERATLIYPGHVSHGKAVSLLTDGKKILALNPSKPEVKRTIDAKGMWLIPGLVDVQCHSGEPGFEDKEDLETLTLAAKAGGFKHLFILPSTEPVIDSKAQALFIQHASGTNGVQLYPLGAISKGLNGRELSEMFDMHQAGVKGFTDGKHPVSDVNMMKRALHYVQNFDGIVCSFPYDERLAPGGQVNESPANTSLGLKSTPALAEELMLNRDLYLLRYTGSKLHVSSISSAGSVNLISQAKKDGLNLSCAVALANLLFDESSLQLFDTNFKTMPPLRSQADRKALIKGLSNGSIDMVMTDHTPEVIENKDVEFNHAHHGMTMLETGLSAIHTELAKEVSMDRLVEAMSLKPRERFGIPMPLLEDGAPFDFTLFDPEASWIYTSKERRSKAMNSPHLDKSFRGKVIAV